MGSIESALHCVFDIWSCNQHLLLISGIDRVPRRLVTHIGLGSSSLAYYIQIGWVPFLILLHLILTLFEIESTGLWLLPRHHVVYRALRSGCSTSQPSSHIVLLRVFQALFEYVGLLLTQLSCRLFRLLLLDLLNSLLLL